MAHSQIFTQWRQPINECYPSEWQQQTHHWTPNRDEENSGSRLRQLQHDRGQWRNSDRIQEQAHQSQHEFQQGLQNVHPQSSWDLHPQPRQWTQNNSQQEWQREQEDQWQAQHSHPWQQHSHSWQQQSHPWRQNTQQQALSELATLVNDSQATLYNQRQYDSFETSTDDIDYDQTRDGETTGELFGELPQNFTEERERCKRKSSEMKDISEGYDTDDEEQILPSCKRQRITVATVERLLARFTLSDSLPTQENDFDLRGNLTQDDPSNQVDKIPLRSDEKNYEGEHNPHLEDSTPHTKGLLGKQVNPFQSGTATKFINQKDSTPNETDTHFGDDAREHDNPEGCDTNSSVFNLNNERYADTLIHYRIQHSDSDETLWAAEDLDNGLSHAGYEGRGSETTQGAADTSQNATAKVKVTFPDQDEEEDANEEPDKEEEEEEESETTLKDEKEEPKSNKFREVSEDYECDSAGNTPTEYATRCEEHSPVQPQEETTYSRWEMKDAPRNYNQEFQKNENDSRCLYNASQNADNVDNALNIPEYPDKNFDGCTRENVSTISTANYSAQDDTFIKHNFNSNDIGDNKNPSTEDNFSSANTGAETTRSTSTSSNTNTSDGTAAGTKRSMDGGGGTAVSEGSSQKRVRKLKSGLRLCSNITCYIEQVLYNC